MYQNPDRICHACFLYSILVPEDEEPNILVFIYSNHNAITVMTLILHVDYLKQVMTLLKHMFQSCSIL